MDVGEERAGLRALYDAVVVGRRDVERLADAELREGLRRHRGVLRRVLDGAGGDDGRLARPSAAGSRRRCRACRGWSGRRSSPESPRRRACRRARASPCRRRRRGTRANESAPAFLMFGTSSVREPSFFSRSMARPRLTSGRRTREGTPSMTAKPSFICGNFSIARRMAKAMKCVNEVLPRPCCLRYWLTMRRFSSKTLTGTLRFEVAVGTPRLVSMFSTIFSAPPRIGAASPFACGARRRASPPAPAGSQAAAASPLRLRRRRQRGGVCVRGSRGFRLRLRRRPARASSAATGHAPAADAPLPPAACACAAVARRRRLGERVLAEQLREVRAPRLVHQRRVAAEAAQQALHVGRVRAEVLRDDLRHIDSVSLFAQGLFTSRLRSSRRPRSHTLKS